MRYRFRLGALAVVAGLIAVACGGGSTAAGGDPTSTTTTSTAAPTSTTTPGTVATTSTTRPPPSTTAPTSTTTAGVAPFELPQNLQAATSEWVTDWSNRTIELTELLVGIRSADPRDVIAPIDRPTFEGTDTASSWLADREPGLLLELEGVSRFYPLQILTLHEIVNDQLGTIPVTVTYCPLCNTGVVFDRRIDGVTHRFGVSGLLRNSDLVMWDDVTESLWQQITGEAIVGTQAGTILTALPSALVRFADFRDSFPDGEVLSQDTGFSYPYGVNPYAGYSTRERPYEFVQGPIDPRFPALERVVGVTVGDTAKAFPFSVISPVGTVNDTIGGAPIVVLWGAADTADALENNEIALGNGIGSGVAFSRVVDGSMLSFEKVDDVTFRDVETGSTWNILGRALSGPMAGAKLDLVTHRNEFWFAWAAFFPDAAVHGT